MKKTSKYIIVIFGVMLILSSSLLTGFSAKLESQESHANSPQPRMNCVKCGWVTSFYCLRNTRYSYSYPHTSTCQVDVYVSNAVDGCLHCGKWQEYYWAHECILEHSTCSKGSEVICTIGWMPDH